MRLNLHAPASGQVHALSSDHPAMVENRTVYRHRVVDVRSGIDLLKRGAENAKLGARVTKGPWAEMPIYSLTLEERATCPASCHMLATCYGNALGYSARYRHGPTLEARIRQEVNHLSRRHPRGFVVRLHVLGDFYSFDYVHAVWAPLLRAHPQLHVWGYTAWPEDSRIGVALRALPWHQFAIRFSSPDRGPQRAVVLSGAKEAIGKKNLIVCPVETGKTNSCGSCGLCWSPAARKKTIGFIAHGR